MIRTVPVPPALAGERVDVAVARLMGLPRTRAAELARAGLVQAGGIKVAKSARLEEGQTLRVEVPEPADQPEPVVELPVTYEDSDLIVINKPAGVAAHAGPGWSGPTVLGSLLAVGVALATGGPPERRGIVQRLDVGTSGLMMVAKSERAYSVLKQMFRDRAVDKTYHALVQGLPDPLEGTIDAPIGRVPGAFKFAVLSNGKSSITHYGLIEAFAGASLLRVDLETGRTHQIRVHLAAVGHPLVGDPFYGGDPKLAVRLGLERQWLHATALGFDHPVTGQPVRCEAPYSADLAAALATLRES
ncbi:MAG: RluA family pseudouridine synthase [Bifidobacteriaceae bacterium]|jgi:23S rRNA pseudouridine1911/1915/1917 synthase|nr:RluA family pseudouridine synthase [Bifidobacteriaceae bacterium]